MKDIGLTFRMIIASTVLMSVYAVIGLVLVIYSGTWFAASGIPLLIIGQYIIATRLPERQEQTIAITPDNNPRLYSRAERIAEDFEINMPEMYLIKSPEMNAFAHGRRNKGKVFLTEKIVHDLSIGELEPIVAHEFAHLRNRDSIVMTLSTTIVSFVSSILLIFFFIASLDFDKGWQRWLVRIMGGMVSISIHFFLLIFVRIVSRYREYVADEMAVKTTNQYGGMVTALTKLENQPRPDNVNSARNAICFMGFSGGLVGRIFATHPSTERRISRVEKLKSDANNST